MIQNIRLIRAFMLPNLETKEHKRVSKSGSEPHFAGDNSRVYFTDSVPKTDYPEQQLVSVDLRRQRPT